MSKDTVTIGCKLPAGLKLEIGYQTTTQATGGAVTAFQKLDSYESYIIRGWNHHSFELRKQLQGTKSTAGVPHGMNTTPYLNRGVPKAFWEEWKRTHKGSWLIKNEILFEVANDDHAGAALRVTEGDKTPGIFMPIDSTKTIVPDVKPLERDEA